MKQALIHLFFILISSVLFSQTQVQEEWVNSVQDLSGLDIELDEFNDVYVLTTNCTIIKYDSNGIGQWTVTYEASTGGETAVDLTVDNSNNTYFTGYIHGIESWHDIVTVKYDPDGNLLWEMIYQSPSWADTSEPIGIATDNLGNVYVSGFSYYSTEFTGYCRCVTIKYNMDGNEEWISFYEPVYDNWIRPSGITVDDFGAVYITGGDGLKEGQVVSLYNFMTIKYNSNGLMQWDEFYYGYQYGWATGKAITLDFDNNVYIAGNCWEPDGWEVVTIKYNENGNILWDSHLATDPLGYSYTPIDIVTDFESNVIITCDNYDEYQVVKYDQFGIEQWVVDTVKPFDLAVDQEGCIYITGRINSDYVTIKYNQTGSQEWMMQYNGVENYNDYSKAITLDSSGNVYITGKCGLENYGISCVTIKYSQSTYANDEDVIFPKILLSNYPNPFNPSTTISFTAEDAKNAEISIYNLKGQKIRTFPVILSEVEGQSSIVWNGTDENNQPVSSGIYFYKLRSGDIEISKKMLMMK